MKERIGLYICHCGGNISDYVDVEEISKLAETEEGIVISKDVMFACADSNQKEMINDIKEKKLDAIVVASCSPKLHLHTFRNVAERAGINAYNYVQVNIREQCSWPHSDNPKEATAKAIGLIRAGIKRVAQSEALDKIEIDAKKAALVLGAGVSGMSAAINLAGLGNEVFLIEKESVVGGRVSDAGQLFMTEQNGKQLVEKLYNKVKSFSNITLFTNSTIEKVTGSLGNFNVEIKINSKPEQESLHLNVGSILAATGFDSYQPKENEYGYKTFENVITLPDFKKLLDQSSDKLIINNRQIKQITFVYCVGNRQTKGENKYCSRFCCTSAIHTSLKVKERFKDTKMIHLYRDIRTYGKQEILYEKSSKQGDLYIRFDEKDPPLIEMQGDKLTVKVKDHLTSKKEFELETDLVVLVTGMVARVDSQQTSEKLKIPIGNDKFFNEIHPKLKPVETVIKGVFIGGACQGPKNISESVQSSLSAVAKIHALLKSGKIALEPIIARLEADKCEWCGKCAEVCEYDAIKPLTINNKTIAEINKASCVGCGICAPVCPTDAINLVQFTNCEIEAMIDGFMEKIEFKETENVIEKNVAEADQISMKEYPQIWKEITSSITKDKKTIPQICEELKQDSSLVTYHLMTMNKYNIIMADGMDEDEAYYYYKLKN